jgi:hypothetical protein
VSVVTGRASLGSITITLVLPLVFAVRAILGHGPWAYVAHGLMTSAVTLWALRPNIKRLLDGSERRVVPRKGA